MEIGKLGQSFLRETALKPQLADGCSKRSTRIELSHDLISKALTTMSLHTISVIMSKPNPGNLDSVFRTGIASDINENGMSSFSTARFAPLPLASEQRKLDLGVANRESADDVPDEILLAKIASGEEEALAHVFRRYARTVVSVGRTVLRNSAEAEDLVQEVFLYVHRKIRLFDPTKGSARSWIFQVAYTQAFIRRRQLQSQGFYSSATTGTIAEASDLNAQGTRYDFTVEGCFGRNGWKKLWDSLTESQRETLRLHFYEGCTFTEIAERLGQSYVNIRHHYYRGLEKLRKHADENALNWP
jgi:RNA polymerase sigma-70 factor (ECF subfamily)